MDIMSLLLEYRNDPDTNLAYNKLLIMLRAYKIKKIMNRNNPRPEISQEQKDAFIQYCLEQYDNNGIDNTISYYIDNEEEEEEPVAVVLPIALEFFLSEYPEIDELGDDERFMFFEYMYGDFELKPDRSNINNLLLVFENGKKKKIY